MQFLNASALALLLLVPAMAVFLAWRERVRFRKLQAISALRSPDELGVGVHPRRRVWRGMLWLSALTAVILALARPAWGTDLVPTEAHNVSVMLVLDVSNSMNAQDLRPSRLERAKLDLQELARSLQSAEVGLVVFAGEALLQFPLTTDRYSIGSFIGAAHSRAISRQGTALETALDLAIRAFDSRRATARYIVVATDGESHDDQPLRAVARAVEAGIVVHALGYGGAEGAPVPVLGDDETPVGYLSRSDGEVVLSALDEQTLRQVAVRSGGIYRRAGQNDAVREVANAIRGSLEQAASTGFQSREVERFGLFVALALIALAAEMLLPEGWSRSI